MNSLSSSIQKLFKTLDLNSETDNKKLIIEVVGQRQDLYQNIFPLLFHNISFISNGLNDFNQNVSISQSDCILLDGPGRILTQSNYYIEYDEKSKLYNLVQKVSQNTNYAYDYFKDNGLYYY